MSDINKRLNLAYNSDPTPLPLCLGDRFYSQDLVRDFWFLQHQTGLSIKNACGDMPIIMSGGTVTKGTGDTLDITVCEGYVYHQVRVPDTFAALPPSSTLVDVITRVVSTVQNDLALPDAVLDDATTNYIKLRYKEDDGNTRTRAISSGTYAYEINPSFEFVVDDVAPTDYDIVLGEFVSSGNAVPSTFDLSNRTPGYLTGNVKVEIVSAVPTNWLEMDGSAISRTTYQNLFAKLGTTYGVGDGSTTFNIPDLRGEFLRGQDNGAGNDPGAGSRTDRGDGTTGDNIGTKQGSAMWRHYHENRSRTGDAYAYVTTTFGSGAGGAWNDTTSQVSDRLQSKDIISDGVGSTPDIDDESRPRNVAVKFLIHI